MPRKPRTYKMSTDIGMINDFIQKEEEVKEELFSDTRHHCIFEINTKTKKHLFVDDFGDDYDSANKMCESMNNFRKPEWPVYFCVRCLDQEEFADVQNYNPINTVIVIKSRG